MLCVNLNIYIQFLFLFIKYRVGTVFSCFLLSLHRSIFFKLIILTQNHTSPLFFLSFVIVLRMVLYHNHHILIWNKEGVTDDAIFGKVRFKQGYYEMIIVIKKNELKSIIVRHMYPTWYIKNWVLWKVRTHNTHTGLSLGVVAGEWGWQTDELDGMWKDPPGFSASPRGAAWYPHSSLFLHSSDWKRLT